MSKYEPTEKQKRLFGEMMLYAFLEIRTLGWEGKAEQAAELADAFHNLPVYMFSAEFDWDLFRYGFLKPYQDKYSRHPDEVQRDYLAMLDEIEKAEN